MDIIKAKSIIKTVIEAELPEAKYSLEKILGTSYLQLEMLGEQRIWNLDNANLSSLFLRLDTAGFLAKVVWKYGNY